ncbi:MAG: TonB-dependent siderophore receptor [Methylovulum miyakonense]|uniref:TonB-dependent siderophore receptor n=1 Tax=Methylovulum miyakonense TaxID=645578 RepID=UPI003BB4E819
MSHPNYKPSFAALLAVLLAQNAHGDSSKHSFNIPAQPLNRALLAFGKQSGQQLMYSTDVAEHLRNRPVEGEYTATEAVNLLLAAAPLQAVTTREGTLTVRPKAMAVADTRPTQEGATLPQVKVTGKAEDAAAWATDPYNTDYQRPNAVTATKTDTPLMQTPMSVKIVPQQVLKDQQVITVDQALRNVSGVVSGAGGTGTFFIRGFGNYNIYRDGFLNRSEWAHTEDLENVEQVEVLKGPGSILYGRTEPGGLVNFVTKKPLDTPYYSLRQQFGSFDHYRTSVDATGPLTANQDLAYRFNLGYQSNNTFQEFGGNERTFVAPSVRWNITDRTTTTARIEYSDIKELGNGTVPLMGNRPAPIPRSRNLGERWNFQEDEYVMVSLNTEHAFNDNWKLRHRFNFTNYTLTMSGQKPDGNWSPVQANGDQTRFFFAQNTDGNDYQHNFFNALELTGKFDTGLFKHTLLVGGDYYRTDSRATMAGFGANPNQYDTINIYHPSHLAGPPAILPADVTYYEKTLPWFGLYAQDQIQLPYHVHVLAGLRYDNAESASSSSGEYGGGRDPDTSFDQVSPRGGVVWQPLPELSLYGSYTENFGAANGFANRIPLPPQTAQQWETGIKTELLNGRFSGTVSYFELTKQNLQVDVAPGITRASGEAESRGIELDLSGEILPGWNIIATYAYTPFAKTIQDSYYANTIGKRLNNAPEHSGSLWTTYAFQHMPPLQGMKVGAGLQAVDERQIGYDETAQAPGYVTANLMGSKLWKVGDARVTAQLNIDNLFDQTYFASIYSYGPTHYGAPRTFMGSIKVEY